MRQEDRRFFQSEILGITVLAPKKAQVEKVGKCLDLLNKEGLGTKVRQLNYILVLPVRDYFNTLFEAEISGIGCLAWVCRYGNIKYSSIAYLSSLILHEAHHATQINTGKEWEREEAELDAAEVQRRFLQKHGTPNEVSWFDQQVKNKWWTKKGNNRADKIHIRYLELLERGGLIIEHL